MSAAKTKGSIYTGKVVGVRDKKAFTKAGEKLRNWIITFDDGFEGENILPDKPGFSPVFREGHSHAYKIEYVGPFGTEIVPAPTPEEAMAKFDAMPNIYPSVSPNRDHLAVIALEAAGTATMYDTTEGLLETAEAILTWLEQKMK